jgi:hypothetical protein
MSSASLFPMILVRRVLLEDGGVSDRFDRSKNQTIIRKQLYRRTDDVWEVVNEGQKWSGPITVPWGTPESTSASPEMFSCNTG